MRKSKSTPPTSTSTPPTIPVRSPVARTSHNNASRTPYRTGFTILEIIIVILFATLALIIFFIQKANMDAMDRDDQRKTAINAMYYALEEGYYPEHGYYPETISEENLTVMDPALFTDPLGVNLGEEGSSYTYEPANCEDGKCKEYTLRATLEKEDVYVKKNRT